MVSFFFSKPNFNQKKDLFEVLLQKGYLTDTQVKNIFSESARLKKAKEEILEEKGLVSDDKLAFAYSIVFDLPIIHLEKETIPQEVLYLIPKEKAEELQIIAFGRGSGRIKIGAVDPFLLLKNQSILNEVIVKNNITPSYVIIPETDFRRALYQYEGGKLEPFKKKDFSPITLEGLEIPREVVEKIPEEIAQKFNIIVFGAVPDKLLKVAVLDPKDAKILEIIDFIEKRTGLNIETYATTKEDLENAFSIYKKPSKIIEKPEIKNLQEEIKEMVGPIKIEKVTTAEESETPEIEFLKKEIKDLKDLEQIVKSGYVPKAVAAMINFACHRRATDIHVQPYEKELLIRFRVDGMLRDIVHIPIEMHLAIISRIKILSKLKIDEQRIPQDGRFDMKFHNRSVDIRVSTLPTACGEKAVLRLLDKTFGVLSLEEIGLEGEPYKRLIGEIEKPFGTIFATGPTGSGKTTTLYAILNRIKNPTVNIITLEDPVEYKIEGVNQSQIRADIGFTFANGLRSILRQDPNIIMVGEVRDPETAFMVTQAALTGHLVLSTLHTNDAASALPRLINMNIEPFLITSSINAIIAQRLVRRVCGKCQTEFHPSKVILNEIDKEIEKMPKEALGLMGIKKPYVMRKGKGCDECDKGYKGRMGIFEVLVMSPSIENVVVKRSPASLIEAEAKKEGMLTMRQDGILKVLKGLTTYEEILRVASK